MEDLLSGPTVSYVLPRLESVLWIGDAPARADSGGTVVDYGPEAVAPFTVCSNCDDRFASQDNAGTSAERNR